MIESRRALGAKEFFLFIVIFLVVTGLAILLDVPILRPVLGFLFFTIIPGLLILYVLKLNKLGLTEKIVLSVGLSISFLMFFGLFIDSVYPLFGYTTPLSTNSLLVSFSIILLILAIAAYLRNRTTSFAKLSHFKLSTGEKASLLLPAFFPLLSILGIHIMNTTDNNIMLIALLFLIPAYAVLIAVRRRNIPERVYPLIIFVCGLSLLLIWALRSNHIVTGADTEQEFYLFNLVADGRRWQIFGGAGPLSSSLSISLLPAILQSLCGMSPEIVFRLFYPLLFSILPLVIYVIAKKYTGSFYAFIACLTFISFYGFWASNFRVNTAIIFFALTIMVLFHNKIPALAKNLLFIIFVASTIVSHYSTTYIFFLLLLLMWIGMQVLLRLNFYRNRVASLLKNPVSKVTAAELGLFFVLLFFWYGQITGAAFGAGVGFVRGTLLNLHKFFDLEASPQIVHHAVGAGYRGTPASIEFVFSWLVILFIAIGVLATTLRYINGNVSAFASTSGSNQQDSPPAKLDPEYLLLGIGACAILAFSVSLPWVAAGYDLFRTYFQMTVLLPVFFVFGGITISKYIKLRPCYLLLIVLVPYFMSTTGTMYQIFGVPRSPVLNSEGNQYNDIIIQTQEYYSARWLGEHAVVDNLNKVYTDHPGWTRVITYGLINPYHVDNSSLTTPATNVDGYIFLRYYAVVHRRFMSQPHAGRWERHDIVEFQDKFVGKGKIYTNGGSEVWK